MAPCPSVPAVGVGDSRLHPPTPVGMLSVLRASATHAAGGAREGETMARTWGEGCPEEQAFPPPATLHAESRDCGGVASRELACGGPVWVSVATLVGRLSKDGDGTCASGHRAGYYHISHPEGRVPADPILPDTIYI